MKKVSVFLADGFEEIEGLTVVDLLRRAGVEVATVSITGDYTIHGAHGINVQADKLFEDMNYDGQDMLVLPGGMPGTLNLGAHKGLQELLNKFYDERKYLAALCAAPSVFGRYATSYPGFEDQLTEAQCVADSVAVDEYVITSRGMGTAIPFSLSLIEVLIGPDKANEIGKSIIYYQ